MAGLNGSEPEAGGSASAAAVTGSAVRVTPAPGSAAPATALVIEGGAGGALVDGVPEAVHLTLLRPPRARLGTQGATHDVLVIPVSDVRRAANGIERVEVVVGGWRFELDVEPEARARLRERATRARGDRARGGPVELRAIIPGRVVSVDVAEGDAVEAGQRVLVVEAMKMQNELRAPRGGTIGQLGVGAGQTVELGDLLLVVE